VRRRREENIHVRGTIAPLATGKNKMEREREGGQEREREREREKKVLIETLVS
jgi:hypothetical protein